MRLFFGRCIFYVWRDVLICNVKHSKRWCTSFGGMWNNMVNKRNVNRLSKHTTVATAMTTTTKTTTPPALAPPPPKIEMIIKKNPVSTSPCHICHWRPDAILFIRLLIITAELNRFEPLLLPFFLFSHDFFTTNLVVCVHWSLITSHHIVIVIWESCSYEIRYIITMTTTIKLMT